MKTQLFSEDIRTLAAERERATVELYEPNDYYGHAALLKRYVEYPADYQIKASIEHGPTITDYVWKNDVTETLPAIFFPAAYRQSILQQHTTKPLFSLGAFIAYAKPHVQEETLRQIKEELGKTMVVFPYHSTHWLTAHLDVQAFCAEIDTAAKGMDSVLVCLYWKDILLGRDAEFRACGYECTTAGHMYDPVFLPRLRSILSLADVTVSNQMGTHVGYSIALGVPHWFISTGTLSLDNPQGVAFDHGVNHEPPPHVREMMGVFAERVDAITPEQRNLAEWYWGASEPLPPEELRGILELTEDLHNRGKRYVAVPDKVLARYTAALIHEQRYSEAGRALRYSNIMYPDTPGIVYARAYLAAVGGKSEEAIAMLHNNIIPIGEHPKMKQLLAELQGRTNEPEMKPAEPVAANGNVQQVEHALAEAIVLLQQEQYKVAFEVLNRAKALRCPVRNLDYLRAVAFAQLGRLVDAKMAVLEELLYYPDHAEAKALLNQIEQSETVPTTVHDDEFQQILGIIRPYTMLSEERLHALYTQAKQLCEANIPGNFVECGVARGGSSALLALVVKRYSRQPRYVYAFDSFEGMPEPTAMDTHKGVAANETGWGTGTCAAPESSVMEAAAKLGAADVVHTVKGYFETTLPHMRDRIGMVALLHVDADWYESTKVVLENLYDRVSNNGRIQIDDYGFWEGCRKAVDEFQTQRALSFDFTHIDATGVCCVKPTFFPMNPVVSAAFADEFRADDPVRQGLLSQMSENERFQLYYVVRRLLNTSAVPLRFVEIGCYAGASLAHTAIALQRVVAHSEGFAIEPVGQPQFYKVLELLQQGVQHIKMWSHEAAAVLRETFAKDGNYPQCIFVDGDHTYEGVKRDILEYYPLLAPGGVMVLHDYLPPLDDRTREAVYAHHANTEPGIRQACTEIMERQFGAEVLDVPLLYPSDPTQTQAHLPIIPGVFSTIRAYRKPLDARWRNTGLVEQ